MTISTKPVYLTPTGKKRLLALADHMEKVSKRQFNFESFIDLPEKGAKAKKIFESLSQKKPKTKSRFDNGRFFFKEGFCGTTACVLGHAATMPEFNKKGLSAEIVVYQDADGKFSYKDLKDAAVYILFEKNGTVMAYDFNAGAEFFQIPRSHAVVLFGSGDSMDQREFYSGDGELPYLDEIKPKQVAKALRTYVETDGNSLQTIIDRQ